MHTVPPETERMQKRTSEMAGKKAATGKGKYVANWQVEGFPTKEGLKTGAKFEAEPSDSLQMLLDVGAVSSLDAEPPAVAGGEVKLS